MAAHRRWGKDEVALHWAAMCMATKPGLYWHMLPELAQGRKAIWDAVNPHTGRKRIDEAFAKHLRVSTRDADMKLTLAGSGRWWGLIVMTG